MENANNVLRNRNKIIAYLSYKETIGQDTLLFLQYDLQLKLIKHYSTFDVV